MKKYKGGVEIQSRVTLSKELEYIKVINGKLCHTLETIRSGSVSYNKSKNRLGCRNSDDKNISLSLSGSHSREVWNKFR